jgi:hypothetical protein
MLKLKRIFLSAFLLVVFLLLICQALRPTLPTLKDIIPDNSVPLVNAQPAPGTLIAHLTNLINAISAAGYWSSSVNNVIVAYQMGVWSWNQLLNYSYYVWNSTGSAWAQADNVLYFFTECQRFNIVNQTEIDWALDRYVMMTNGLPESQYTSSAFGFPVFGITQRYELEGFYWANQFNHNTTAWNVTTAYASFKTTINSYYDGAPAAYFITQGDTDWLDWGNGAPRYYDELAEVIDAFLKFYIIGTAFPGLINATDALTEAVMSWNWYNNNGWIQNGISSHYMYHTDGNDPYGPSWECESGSFFQIALELEYYYGNALPNVGRIVLDMYDRYIVRGWSSPAWAPGGGAIVHAASYQGSGANPETRAPLVALSSLLGGWIALNSTQQAMLSAMICGTGGSQPAWELLYTNTNLNLYNPTTGLFQTVSEGNWATAQYVAAVAYAPTLLFMEGLVPRTATLAVPIQDNIYEDTNALTDGQLFNIDITTCTITVSILTPGTITFIYGSTPVNDTFTAQGTYQVTFDPTWNTITSTTYLSGLPSNRLFMGQVLSGCEIPQVTTSKTVVGRGYSLDVTVMAADLGSHPETFNVTAYANTTSIASQNVTFLSGSSTDITFTWNTTGFAYGNYTVSAYAWPVQNETNTANITFTGGTVYVGIPGDINGDGTVNKFDAITLCNAFSATPASPNWNPNADINGDGTVDIYDAIILASNYGLSVS